MLLLLNLSPISESIIRISKRYTGPFLKPLNAREALRLDYNHQAGHGFAVVLGKSVDITLVRGG